MTTTDQEELRKFALLGARQAIVEAQTLIDRLNGTSPQHPKRHLSAAGRAAIAAASRRRWAKIRAAKRKRPQAA